MFIVVWYKLKVGVTRLEQKISVFAKKVRDNPIIIYYNRKRYYNHQQKGRYL